MQLKMMLIHLLHQLKLEQTLLDYGRDLTLEKNIISLNLSKSSIS